MKADMHVHSKYSPDSATEPAEIIKAAKKKGLDAVAVCDHDTMRGAFKTRKIAGDFGVILAEEVSTDRGHVIGYDLTDEIKSKRFYDVLDEIKSQGGRICIPHAFDRLRLSSSVRDPKLVESVSKKIDYLEVNGRTLPLFNNKAVEFARIHNIQVIGGSDAHVRWEVGSVYTKFIDNKPHVVGKSTYPGMIWTVFTAVAKRVGLTSII